MSAAIKIEAGQRFGRWTVIAKTTNGSSAKRRFICKCDCGNTGAVAASVLVHGTSKSCGCLRAEVTATTHRIHGHASVKNTSKTYDVWLQMRGRCQRATHKDFKYYGGRGITICERWEKFENFLADMGEAPLGLTIERRDKNGNYEPGNCSWESRTVQMNNTRLNVLVTEHDGTFTLKEFSLRNGLSYGSTRQAMKRGVRVFAGKSVSVQYPRNSQ